VPFAEHLKKNVKNILVGSVGLITDPHQANDILESDQADVVLMARQVLRDIDFPLRAALELGVAVSPAVQYERSWTRMVVKREHCDDQNGVKHISGEVEGEEGHNKNRSRAPPEVHSSIP
jgi:2,4-dienoyl-CoA reductase-like NADH-dependent reductase (Old Yellow Enzyme family)